MKILIVAMSEKLFESLGEKSKGAGLMYLGHCIAAGQDIEGATILLTFDSWEELEGSDVNPYRIASALDKFPDKVNQSEFVVIEVGDDGKEVTFEVTRLDTDTLPKLQ